MVEQEDVANFLGNYKSSPTSVQPSIVGNVRAIVKNLNPTHEGQGFVILGVKKYLEWLFFFGGS